LQIKRFPKMLVTINTQQRNQKRLCISANKGRNFLEVKQAQSIAEEKGAPEGGIQALALGFRGQRAKKGKSEKCHRPSLQEMGKNKGRYDERSRI